ncbi:hypothetical protein [Hymenobacter algoricola]|uniref:Uncharacterized protein n=1 Tax=Hymenobacter algoricola TaxID=486267 RepID=A0ABP7MUX2_9BACT
MLHDSPQRGAYNPLGVQAVTRALDGTNLLGIIRLSHVNDEVKETVDVLNAPATQQLSILYATDGTGGYTTNSFLEGAGSPYRQMVNYTAPYQIVATSQGSQCGVGQGLAPHTELSRTNGQIWLYPIVGVAGKRPNSIKVEAISNALPAYGQSGRIGYLRV